MTHVVHWDDCEGRDRHAGDIHATWFDLGRLGGSDRVGLSRIAIQPGRRSTPAHIHGAEEEIFHVLSGTGLLWQDGDVCEVGPGDTVAHPANAQTHTLRAGDQVLDVLAFGTRVPLELCYLPRAGHAWAGPTVVEAPGMRNLFKLDDAAGDFVFPEPGKRHPNVAALDDVEPMPAGPEVRVRRDLGAATGTVRTGLKHITSEPGRLVCAPHCHSAEEEIFVVTEGSGTFHAGEEVHEVRAGHAVSRRPGTGVPHWFEAGPEGMTHLAYGTREPNDIVYYPETGEVLLCGVGVRLKAP
jgi:uncharacterized cupin superfamily protein